MILKPNTVFSFFSKLLHIQCCDYLLKENNYTKGYEFSLVSVLSVLIIHE